MLARRAPQAGRRSERSPERRKSAWLSASRQCRAAQGPVVRQGGPGVCAGEGAGSTSEAPEALLATGEASSSEEEQGCSRAQLRTRAASLSRLAVGEGSAGLTGEGVAGGAGEGGMLMGMLAEEVSVSRSWRVVQRARGERTVGESTVQAGLKKGLRGGSGRGACPPRAMDLAGRQPEWRAWRTFSWTCRLAVVSSRL